MKSFFKFLLIIYLVSLSTSVLASTPYINPNYNLRNVNEIIITQIDNTYELPSDNFTPDKVADIKVLSSILETAGKKKFVVTDMRNNPNWERNGVAVQNPQTLELRIIINSFGYKTIDVPGYFETVTVDETRHYYDRDGIRHTYTEPVKKQQWVDGYKYKNAYLDLIYNFYDINTDTLVASFNDSRIREYEVDPASGMLKRSTKDCFKKIFKK